jgi:NAD(P)-dependent dehydrogenase (short-subunit alcohol dehydrogenase family)
LRNPVYGEEAVAALQEFVTSSCPVPRLGTCPDIADSVLFLASDAASYVNGVRLVVDGGLTRVHAATLLG